MLSADSSLTEDECDSPSRICEEVGMANGQRARERITEEVTSWPGVLAGPGRRGEFAFKLARREVGHLHGDHTAHFGFPRTCGRASSSKDASTTPGLFRQAWLGRASDRGGGRRPRRDRAHATQPRACGSRPRCRGGVGRLRRRSSGRRRSPSLSASPLSSEGPAASEAVDA
jgi:hypothetical protein